MPTVKLDVEGTVVQIEYEGPLGQQKAGALEDLEARFDQALGIINKVGQNKGDGKTLTETQAKLDQSHTDAVRLNDFSGVESVAVSIAVVLSHSGKGRPAIRANRSSYLSTT